MLKGCFVISHSPAWGLIVQLFHGCDIHNFISLKLGVTPTSCSQSGYLTKCFVEKLVTLLIVIKYKSFTGYEEVQRRKSGECEITFSSVDC